MLTFVNGTVDSFRQLIPLKAVKLAHPLPVKQIRTVMIVDDEPVDRFIAEQTVLRTSEEGWRVISFPSTTKALNFMSFNIAHGGTLPDVILLDLLMPDLDGFEFLQNVRSLYPHQYKTSRIIAVTISEDRARWRKALVYGAAEVIVKPLTADKWLAVREAKH